MPTPVNVTNNKLGNVYLTTPRLRQFEALLKQCGIQPDEAGNIAIPISDLLFNLAEIAAKASGTDIAQLEKEIADLTADRATLQEELMTLKDSFKVENDLFTGQLESQIATLQDEKSALQERHEKLITDFNELFETSKEKLKDAQERFDFLYERTRIPQLEAIREDFESKAKKPFTLAETFAFLMQQWQKGHDAPEIKTPKA